MEYSQSARSFISYTIGANLRYRSLFYNFGWYKTQKQFVNNAYFRPASNRLVTNGSLGLFDGLVRINGAIDYDFKRKRLLNYLIGGSLNGQCMGLRVELRKLNILNILGQQDLQFRASLTLGGLKSLLTAED